MENGECELRMKNQKFWVKGQIWCLETLKYIVVEAYFSQKLIIAHKYEQKSVCFAVAAL